MKIRQIVKSLLPPIICNAVRAAHFRLFSKKVHSIQSTQVGLASHQQFELNGRVIRLPLTHSLPSLLARHRHYEGEISRIAEYLLTIEGKLVVIDVGANVGDTIISIPSWKKGAFLCIEGSCSYSALLQENFNDCPNVICVHALLSDAPAETGCILELHGTGHVDGDGGPSSSIVKTLDMVLKECQDFPIPNFLKIDTDGFDFKVMRGGSHLLRTHRPVIHFELSFCHWSRFGKSHWTDAAEFLSKLGYEKCLLYDNDGYLLGLDEFSAPALLPLMEAYSSRRRFFYLNVITFHAESFLADAFIQAELSRGYDPPWI